MAGPTITFDSSASDEQVAEYMASAEAFIFASFEDFGITPVEAMAAGTPVIAYQAGGAQDYVVPGKTGEFFNAQTVESLSESLKNFDSNKYDRDDIKMVSSKYSNDTFRRKFKEYVNSVTIE